MTATMSRRTLSLVMLLGFVAGALKAAPAVAQTVNPLQSQEANTAGIIAELIECKREAGVLTIRLRLRNTTDKKVSLYLIGGDQGHKYDAYYVTAENKKYFILRDSEKNALATHPGLGGNVVVHLDKGDAYVWWAKYPAPPAEVKKVSYYTPLAPPFDNVPIND
jgi:hypothetical protein